MKRKNGRPLRNNRPVRIVELDEVHPNYIAAADAINGSRCNVYLCLTGSRKKHLGYTFEYADDSENTEKST